MGTLKKKGDIDTTVFLWAFTLILLAFVVVTLVLFIEDSANNTGFKNYERSSQKIVLCISS